MEREGSKRVSGINSSSSIYQKPCIIADRSSSISAYLRPDQEKDQHLGDDSNEISIFEAQKYFNESIIDVVGKVSNNNNIGVAKQRAILPLGNSVIIDNVEQPSRFSWASSSVHDEYSSSSISMGRNNYRARSFHAAATPTASSEASWNSQTGLLSHPPGTVGVSLRSPTHHHDHQEKSRGMTSSSSSSSPSSPRVRWFSFPRRCPCSGRESVRVEEKMSSQQQLPNSTSVSHSSAAASASSTAPSMLRNMSSINVSRSISLDLRIQTPKPLSMLSTGATNPNSLVAGRGDDGHHHHPVMWSQENRRPWEGQVSTNMAKGNSHSRLFTNVPAAAAEKDPCSSNMLQVQAQQNIASTNGFSFPILKLNPAAKNTTTSTTSVKQPTLGLDTLVTCDEQSSTRLTIQKPADQLSGFTFPASPKSRVILNNEDDMGSDASSDLFEIESFSATTQTTSVNHNTSMLYQYYHRRDSLEDDASSFNANRGLYRRRSSLDLEPMTPLSVADQYCYEPSEASIDWSVTTAEGLDHRPSAASEADHYHHHHHEDELEKSRRRSSGNYGLLSCRWEKAVSVVGPNPVRAVQLNMAASGGGDEGHAVMKHVGSRPPLPNKPPRSHMSIPFAT